MAKLHADAIGVAVSMVTVTDRQDAGSEQGFGSQAKLDSDFLLGLPLFEK